MEIERETILTVSTASGEKEFEDGKFREGGTKWINGNVLFADIFMTRSRGIRIVG
jgi:hypothetical protein